MRKSNKKSANKVDAAPAVVATQNSVKKGKREAEEVLVKQIIAKKQKRDEGVEQALEEKKVKPKIQVKKTKEEESSSSDDSSSEEETQKPKAASPTKIHATAVNKPATSSSDSSSDEDEAVVANNPVSKLQNEPLKNDSDESDSEEESSDDDDDPKIMKTKIAAGKKESSSNNESSDGSDDEHKKTPLKDADVEMKDASPGTNGKTALELHNEYFNNRTVKISLAQEKGSSGASRKENPYSQGQGGKSQFKTLFIRGLDKRAGEDQTYLSE
ncbi:hypothetical protein SAY86_005098 [Trapa natans]|uniref:Uncharacterized protein n=1 Tax=Trapa natans TaxID=22666 RepID=A0AAN7L7A8_TRANT|nr:hypothetical protein SAY86_005098 [Trapa natans]